MSQSKSPFSRLWKAVLFTRDVVSILLLVLALSSIVILLLAVKAVLPTPPVVAQQTTLVLDLSTPIVEGYEATGLPRFVQKIINNEPDQARLYDMLHGLALAAEDPRITQLAVVAPSPRQLGMAQARELSAAVRMFKETSGKPVYAYGLFPSQAQYLVMAAADEIYLDQEGSVLLEGIASYRPYFRSALVDKLGVDIHLFRVGQYKSAAEPFIRDDESPESREASLFWMNDVWSRYLDDISQLRPLSSQLLRERSNSLANDIAASSGDLAQFALDNGLVDGLLTDMDFHRKLGDSGKLDMDTSTVVRMDLPTYSSVRSIGSPRPQIALVPIQGEIIDGEPVAGRASAPEVVSRLREVGQDPNIKAVVVRIDSPGGSVVGSEMIRREVSRLADSGRQVVVSMGNVSASGGYWIATASETIVADPSTITGSIGIFGLLPNFTRALDKVGVHTDGTSTAPMAGAFDPTRPLSDTAAEAMQQVINNGYKKFLLRVSKARNMSMEDVNEVAQGRVWTGHQAQERGLVDRQGGLMTAIISAARQANLPQNATVAIYDGQSSGVRWNSGQKWGARLIQEALGIKTPLEYIGVKTPTWLEQAAQPSAPLQSRVYAHCLCVP